MTNKELINKIKQYPLGDDGVKYLDRNNKIWTLDTLRNNDDESRKSVSLKSIDVPISFTRDNLDTIKPILNPLSLLTEEIEVDGEKFDDFIELLRDIYGHCCITWSLDGENIIESECENELAKSVTKNYNMNTIPYYIHELLLKHKFDVFGLIDSGHAISTLDKRFKGIKKA